eukprot:m.754413 g.754413  ORF g.754413 m.754413 type:complete len:71 (-) comp23175_c0_seq32:1970-2182(-)
MIEMCSTTSGHILPHLRSTQQAYIVVGDFVYMTHNCDLVDSLGIARVSILGETGWWQCSFALACVADMLT